MSSSEPIPGGKWGRNRKTGPKCATRLRGGESHRPITKKSQNDRGKVQGCLGQKIQKCHVARVLDYDRGRKRTKTVQGKKKRDTRQRAKLIMMNNRGKKKRKRVSGDEETDVTTKKRHYR